MIEIDGSYGEGGGQIVRTALALAALTNKAFKVINIRKGRPNKGLKTQHLFAINILKDLCNAEVSGNKLGSEFIEFKPKKFDPKNINVDIGTAGSITLLLQAILPPCLFAEKAIKIRIKGGTDTKWSMPIDYFSNVFLPQLKKYADINFSLIRRGYYPKGNGEIELKIKPRYSLEDKDIPKINLEKQGKLVFIKGVSHASKDLINAKVAERQAEAVKLSLLKICEDVSIRTEYCDTLSTGSGICLFAYFSNNDEIERKNPVILGGGALGEKGKKSEKVGQEAAQNLIKQIKSKALVDEHLEDNLIPYLGLIGGKFRVNKLTEHTKTNIFVVEKFLGKRFNIENNIICSKKQD